MERTASNFRDLLDRAVFDERTGAVAISHGGSPLYVDGRRRGAWEGREFLAGGLRIK